MPLAQGQDAPTAAGDHLDLLHRDQLSKAATSRSVFANVCHITAYASMPVAAADATAGDLCPG